MPFNLVKSEVIATFISTAPNSDPATTLKLTFDKTELTRIYMYKNGSFSIDIISKEDVQIVLSMLTSITNFLKIEGSLGEQDLKELQKSQALAGRLVDLK